jgi:MFS family permease
VSVLTSYVRSLNPDLPRSVQTLQAGALLNAFGNGLAYPFLFIYLHNVRGISLGVTGLIVATNSVVGLVAGPLSGPLVDRFGGRRMLALSLGLMTLGFGSYVFVHRPWQGFLASAVAGVGNAAFWPSQSTLIAGLAPPERRHAAFAVQRIMMNLGIGLGAMTGGFIALTSDPRTFTILFLGDALTFLLYAGVLPFVPEPRAEDGDGKRGTYMHVLRHRVFMGVIALNFVLIAAGMSQIEVFPAYAKNHSGVSEQGIGWIFLVNTLLIVVAQLPVVKLLGGRRRMRSQALVGVVWAVSWVLVALVGWSFSGVSATILFALVFAVFGIGECLHGAVQAPLVADLADHRLIGRYMAASAFSWQVGFSAGPAAAGFLLAYSPTALWLGAAAVLLCASGGALALERALPPQVRRTPGEHGAQLEPGSAARMANSAMRLDDPLSTDAQPATHQAPPAPRSRAGRGWHARRTTRR